MGSGQLRWNPLVGFGLVTASYVAPASTTGMVLDGPTKRLGYKFWSPATQTVSAVDLNWSVTGTVTGHTYTIEIQTDASDAPSGTLVGTASSAFAGPAAAGFIGAKALGSNAALTINTPYWIVVKVASGTPDASNFVQARDVGSGSAFNQQKVRNFNGTDWTTVAAVARVPATVITLTPTDYSGAPMTANRAASGQTKAFGTNRQAISFKYGATALIPGVVLRLSKAGAPADLEVLIFEGSTQKATATYPAASITSDTPFFVGFATPLPTVAANTKGYLVLRSLADGGTSTNAYDLYAYAYQSGYDLAIQPTDVQMLIGTGNDPTAYSVAANLAPLSGPLITTPTTDLVGTVNVTNNIYSVMD